MAVKKKKKTTKNRKSLLTRNEREKWLNIVNSHFGTTYVQKRLNAAGDKIKEWEPVLKQLKRQMDDEIEQEEKEAAEYYKEIDKDYRTVGRPKSVFSEKELKYLCNLHCSLEEIAGFFQMHKDTLQKRIKKEYGITWAEFFEQNSQGAKVALRRQQIRTAMEGDTKMQIFLGKNLLGQKEKLDFEGEVKVNSWVDLMNNLDDNDDDEENDNDE